MTYEEVLQQYQQDVAQSQKNRRLVEQEIMRLLGERPDEFWTVGGLVDELRDGVSESERFIQGVIYHLIISDTIMLQSNNRLVKAV